MSNLISCVSWVRRGVSVQHPAKYVLDDKELERVSTLARIELEDARVELERAHEAAKSMNRDDGDMEADDSNNDEDSWVELVFYISLNRSIANFQLFK
jgi:periodic tryptophan protein 1